MSSPNTSVASAPEFKPRSPAYFAWHRFIANKAAVAGGIVLALLILAAIFAPLFTKTAPTAQAFLTSSLAFPSGEFWFGVDELGRDLFTRVIYGARVSLTIGFAAATVSMLIGIPLGALAGFYGGKLDWFVMRVIELFSVVPPLLGAMLLGALTGGGFVTIIVIAALFGWPGFCLLVRAQVRAFREKDFVRASRALGASPLYIIRRHLIPNAISPIIVAYAMAIPGAMMLEASLSFLGIGVPPPTPSWGQMINAGMNFIFFYWHMALFPTAFLGITVLATTLFGDGLRDALDPTQKAR